MKKFILTFAVAAMATIIASAQQIAVVNGSVTNTYQTLQDAIEGARDNSVIYLPGGGFTIADSVKITKPLTIIGISHKANSENVDGCTSISGNLFFNEGSSGSAVMGCFISGNINIGDNDARVTGITIRYCNLNAISVKNSECSDLIVNQNYIRSLSEFSNTNPKITNNVMYAVRDIVGGVIVNNVIVGSHGESWRGAVPIRYASSSTIMGNVCIDYRPYENGIWCDGQITGNMCRREYGDNCIIVDDEWGDVFKNNAGVNPVSDYHFKDKYKEYETKVGIYAGTSFSDGALPPVPYISEKKIAEQTDAAGKLSIQIKVNAGYNDGSLQGGTGAGTEPDVPVFSGDEDGM